MYKLIKKFFSQRRKDEWQELVALNYKVIKNEIEQAKTVDDLAQIYPRLLFAYEYFRMIRGESFHKQRPHYSGARQKDIYKMEDELLRQLKILSKKIDPNDERVKYYLEEAKGWIKVL